MAPKKGGLGRGLGALLPEEVPLFDEEGKENEKVVSTTTVIETENSVKYISVHDIFPNENQPRKTFDPDKIEELANSIMEHGLIQPIIVRVVDKGYEIVAGERRWRACIKAGLTEVPTLVRTLTDEEHMLLAIIENMQREDLNAIEEAEGLNQMIETYNMTQEQVSKSVGKSRPYITNALRLLKLPKNIRDAVQSGLISQGHGRALINLEEPKQQEIFKKIVNNGLSVREVEKLVNASEKKKPQAKKKEKNADHISLEAELKEILGTKVNILEQGKKGKIEIEYYSREELERLIDLLKSFK